MWVNCASCDRPINTVRAGYFVLRHSPREPGYMSCCIVHHPAHSPNQMTDAQGQYMQNCFLGFEDFQAHVNEAGLGNKGLFLTFPLDALIEFSESHLTVEIGEAGEHLTYRINHELNEYEQWGKTVEGLKVLLPEHFNN